MTYELSKMSIPVGVPLNDFKPSQNLLNTECKFLMTGRLVDKKNPLLTLGAFQICKNKVANCSLTIIGDGVLRESCESFVKSAQLTECVRFLGAQPPDVVRHEMSSANIFLQHSVTAESGDKEGWPVAIAEAAASSLPVISTRHASIPEQVIDGVTGYIVNEYDQSDMAKKMIQLASSPEQRLSFGQAAREHISQWDTFKQVARLKNLIIDVINGKR